MRQPPLPARLADLIAGLESAGMSRAAIAEAIGVSRQHVWNLANGDARQPSYGVVRQLEALAERQAILSNSPPMRANR